MKKISIIIAIVILCVSLASCASVVHNHTYSSDWSHDDINHWHKATCGHDGEMFGKEPHRFSESGITDKGEYTRVCVDCGYRSVISENSNNIFKYELINDGNAYRILGMDDSLGGENDVVIPNMYNNKPVTEIAENAFKGNKGIKNIFISDGIERIGANAFANCENLKSINIADSVKYVGADAFVGCSQAISEESGISYVDKWVVSCSKDATFATVKNDTVGIAGGAFSYCSNLVSVTIPQSVSVICDYAFYACTNLVKLELKSGLKTIGEYSFFACQNLSNISIEKGIEEIGMSAFRGCENLSRITYSGTKTEWNSIEKEYDWDSQTPKFTIVCNDGNISK